MPSNLEILEALYSKDLSDPKVIRAIFDMGRNMSDRNVITQARDMAYRSALASVPGGLPLVRDILFSMAQWDFDAYLQAMEWSRKPEDRFYLPRRKQLAPIVNGIQDLSDDLLDELFISMPPRVGKSTLMIFYMTWMLGKHPEKSNLYCSYSDTLTQAFYNGVLEIINDPNTYSWGRIFPMAQVVRTKSDDEIVDINRRKHYPSLTCRSLYGTLNGACDATGLLISDDLLSGIEEALSKDRLTTVWGKVDNNMLTRAKLDQGCKLLWCGTRWSIRDPIGIRITTLTDTKVKQRRFRVVNVPALNEKDESNFDYAYGVGFSTETYHQRRASFEHNDDIASWQAQYMGEPIEREGAVFSPGSLRYYNGVLPDEDPVRIFMAVDPAWGGGDYVAAPVIYKYGDMLYVHDVVYSNDDKTVTQPMLAGAIARYAVQACQVEASKMTADYAEGIEKYLARPCNLITRPASTSAGSKEQRIFDKAPDIRQRMVFRESGCRSKEYELFMQNVFSFKIIGKNKHDDAPDSLAMAITMDEETGYRSHIGTRLF
jgi:hypothetical protein